jgi:hypothetical protein
VAGTLSLGSIDQALWADRCWRGKADASAEATITWDPDGLYLNCRVVDDVHVSDGNQDDLYENDSLQVYFDFRRKHHAEHSFTPGVAAYIMMPSADKKDVQIGRFRTAALRHAGSPQRVCRPQRSPPPTATGSRCSSLTPVSGSTLSDQGR